MKHDLKTWTEPFQQMWMGNKTAEFRKNDRGFKVGDTLLLREWLPSKDKYTGREIEAEITHITFDHGITSGYAMLSLGGDMEMRQA